MYILFSKNVQIMSQEMFGILDPRIPQNRNSAYRMAESVLHPVCVCVSVSHTFPNAPASPEEDEEKEIYCCRRGEGQFISDL